MSAAAAAERGFTLLELLLVMMVLGLVAALAVPRLVAWEDPLAAAARELDQLLTAERQRALREAGVRLVAPGSLSLARGAVQGEGRPIQFLADGTTEGGLVTLRDGGRELVLLVEPLTAALRVLPAR
jgi:prepilin-type N-terminal cleavage/methylation domain-containing protein